MKVLTVTTKFVTLVLSVGGQDNDVKYTIRRVLAISANEYTCKTRLSNQNSQIIFEKDCTTDEFSSKLFIWIPEGEDKGRSVLVPISMKTTAR